MAPNSICRIRLRCVRPTASWAINMGRRARVVQGLGVVLYDLLHDLGVAAQLGPLAHEPGFDWVGAAYAGITSMGGEPNGPPLFPMVAVGDVSTGAHAMGAICAALLYRERTGRGQHLDLSLLDTYAHYHEGSFQMHSLSKGAITPTRSGSILCRRSAISPAGACCSTTSSTRSSVLSGVRRRRATSRR